MFWIYQSFTVSSSYYGAKKWSGTAMPKHQNCFHKDNPVLIWQHMSLNIDIQFLVIVTLSCRKCHNMKQEGLAACYYYMPYILYLSHSCLSVKLLITVTKTVQIMYFIQEYKLNPAKIGGILFVNEALSRSWQDGLEMKWLLSPAHNALSFANQSGIGSAPDKWCMWYEITALRIFLLNISGGKDADA